MEALKRQDTNTPEWQDALEKETIVSAKTDEILLMRMGKTERTEKGNNREQDAGIDFRLNNMVVDEKAAFSCWDFDLPTYALEIYHEAHQNHEGWFNSSISETTHYLLVYVRADDKELSHIWKWEGLFMNAKLLHEYYKYIEPFVNEIKPHIDLSKVPKGNNYAFTLYDGGKSDTAKLIISTKFDKDVINLQLSKALLLKMCKRRIAWQEKKNGQTKLSDTISVAYIPNETIERLKQFAEHTDEKVEEFKLFFNQLPSVL